MMCAIALLLIPVLLIMAMFSALGVAKASIPNQKIPKITASELRWKVSHTRSLQNLVFAGVGFCVVSVGWLAVCFSLFVFEVQRNYGQLQQERRLRTDIGAIDRDMLVKYGEPTLGRDLLITTLLASFLVFAGSVAILIIGQNNYTELRVMKTGIRLKSPFSKEFSVDWFEVEEMYQSNSIITIVCYVRYELMCIQASTEQVSEVFTYLETARKEATKLTQKRIPAELSKLLAKDY